MRIGICGGGPAGLYFAVLMKRADPGHEVTVVERNPADATYGWGVVLSEESLSQLRDADDATYLAIDEALVRWNAVDVRYRDEVVRSVGHHFAAIARTELLRLLQQRAQALGVDLRFRQPVDDLGRFAGHDLVVGADGVNSAVRAQYAGQFGTTFQPHVSKYAWFGAEGAFSVFTFIFRPTEHGLFQAHAYPFDAQGSTFIVECAERTWRRAGLDTMSEVDSLAFCQRLFADHLGERKLRSNRSLWTTFVTVRNRSWHHGNVVLLGDAAHTAHFSIGSGTRLAIQDAIALAKALVAHPGDLDAAFVAYELARQAVVERFQEVATDSARYFESVHRYLGFAPEQFAFNLLTRSGRISHLDLELRDPALVNRVDRWYREQATGAKAEGRRIVTSPPLLAPLRLRGLVLPNRVALAPAGLDRAVDGVVGQEGAAQVVDAAAPGAGLVVTEPTAVSAAGRVTSGSAGLYTDAQAAAWAALVERVHAETGARVALRLSHAGRRGSCAPRGRGLDRPLNGGGHPPGPLTSGWTLAAPSPLPYTPRSPLPEELDRAGMDAVRDAFAAAAARAGKAGFDLLVLDCADGYLLASFLSPLSNRRTDSYGGELDARLRFPLEVLDAVRTAWPEDRPLAVRLVADDRAAGGLRPADGVAIARVLAAHACDLIDVTGGHTIASEAVAADCRRLFNVGLADELCNEAGVPAVASGHITRLDEVNTILAAGRADLCVLDPGRYG
ncbi:MAG: FAD-dependent monooxygenase [Egibacteraceae bacterium]